MPDRNQIKERCDVKMIQRERRKHEIGMWNDQLEQTLPQT